jgi:hypothetical protein
VAATKNLVPILPAEVAVAALFTAFWAGPIVHPLMAFDAADHVILVIPLSFPRLDGLGTDILLRIGARATALTESAPELAAKSS